MRAGYGMYFDETQRAMFAQNVQGATDWEYTDAFRTDVYIGNVSLSNPAGGPQANGCFLLNGLQGLTQICPPWWTLVPASFATSESFETPRWQHWNVGVQRRLYSRGMIDLGYVGGRGDHLLRYVDINQPQAADQGGPANLARPFLGYDAILMRETTARSRYDGLVTSFRHEAGRAGSATVNYTFSRNKADATYDNSDIDNPQNPLDKDAEFASAGTDRTHIFTASYVYELPFAREATGGWRKGLLGGWQIAGITRIESGPAARIQVANCNWGGWCIDTSPLRPNQVGDPGAGDQDGLLWFNPAAFESPPAREYGTAPVAAFRLPGRHQWDFTVSKTVSLDRYVSSPVQGRPDQRVQSDPVPRRQYRVFCAPRDDDVLQYARSFWFRTSHEHATASRDPAWREAELVTPAGHEGRQPILERPSLRALVAFLSRLLIVCAALVSGHSSAPAAQAAGVQTTTPIPGFAASLQMITELLDRGRGIEAENVARALLARVESTMGRDVREVADVLDLLGRAIRRSSKVKQRGEDGARRAGRGDQGKDAWPRTSGAGDEPHQPWRPAGAGGRSGMRQNHCSSGRWPFEKPLSVPTTCWSPAALHEASAGC